MNMEAQKYTTAIDKGIVGKNATKSSRENIQKMLEEIDYKEINKELNAKLNKEKILEQLLKEINEFKLIKDLKKDNTHHITIILECYRLLMDNFPNSIELTTATDAFLSIKKVHPEVSNYIDQFLKRRN